MPIWPAINLRFRPVANDDVRPLDGKRYPWKPEGRGVGNDAFGNDDHAWTLPVSACALERPSQTRCKSSVGHPPRPARYGHRAPPRHREETPRHVTRLRLAGRPGDKVITFEELGPGLYATTAEGDPNSGVIVGDEAVLLVDARATSAPSQRTGNWPVRVPRVKPSSAELPR